MSITRILDTATPESSPDILTPVPSEPSHEEISRLAYAYWRQRGDESGSPEEDWLRAEAALRKTPPAGDNL